MINDSRIKNILLFGGSFNPPHLGHQIVMEQAFELIPQIDELWLLPTYNHTFGKHLAPATDRLAMCQLLINSCRREDFSTQGSAGSRVEKNNYVERIQLCSIEIDRRTSGSTYEALQLLKQKDHDSSLVNHYSFLMGSDQLPTFNKWVNYQQLLEAMHFYIYPRGSHRHPIEFANMTLLESPTQVITNISSTLIRDRMTKNLPINRIVPQNVLDYIDHHHLYL